MVTEKTDGTEEGRGVPGRDDPESEKFWLEMDGPRFAEFLLQKIKTVVVADKEYEVAKYFSPEFLTEIFEGSVKSITDWQDMGTMTKSIAYWMSVGTVSGIIFGRNVPQS
jgi:hypothetical protein